MEISLSFELKSEDFEKQRKILKRLPNNITYNEEFEISPEYYQIISSFLSKIDNIRSAIKKADITLAELVLRKKIDEGTQRKILKKSQSEFNSHLKKSAFSMGASFLVIIIASLVKSFAPRLSDIYNIFLVFGLVFWFVSFGLTLYLLTKKKPLIKTYFNKHLKLSMQELSKDFIKSSKLEKTSTYLEPEIALVLIKDAIKETNLPINITCKLDSKGQDIYIELIYPDLNELFFPILQGDFRIKTQHQTDVNKKYCDLVILSTLIIINNILETIPQLTRLNLEIKQQKNKIITLAFDRHQFNLVNPDAGDVIPEIIKLNAQMNITSESKFNPLNLKQIEIDLKEDYQKQKTISEVLSSIKEKEDLSDKSDYLEEAISKIDINIFNKSNKNEKDKKDKISLSLYTK